jgi:hypothetical protein
MNQPIGFCLSLLVTVLSGYWLYRVDAPLRKAGFDIAAFELARSPAESRDILASYANTPGAPEALRSSLLYDSALFIPAYTLSLVLGCLLASRFLESKGYALGARVGLSMVACSLVAGILDYVENLGLYRQAETPGSLGWWRITFGSSSTKWALVAVVVLYGLGVLGFAAWSRIFK